MITRIDLNGAQWTVRQADTRKTYPAVVPGTVQGDLLRAKVIPDPFYRDNEKLVQWVGEKEWIYERTFEAADFAKCSRVVLCCEGLDTLATVLVNGKVVGKSENMHCWFEFDVKGVLKKGKNSLAVIFASPFPYCAEKAAASPHKMNMWCPPHEETNRAWIRKAQCHFGWDWGPVLVTAGIWRPMSIVAYNAARIAEVSVQQAHTKECVRLDVGAELELLEAADAEIVARVKFAGKVVDEARVPASKRAALKLCVKDAQLWWPNGLGEQPLYDVEVEVVQGGTKLDAMTKRVGLRELVLSRKKDEWGESFEFACNGVSFFSKGANWIPSDSILTRMTRKTYADILGSAAAANMNMLRVWGGGIYEQDCFYDLCDELGICVWQDCMFACSTYPSFDKEWMANVKVEFEQNITRLSTHACLALVCGNNELEQGLVGDNGWDKGQMTWADYKALYDVLIRDVAAKCAPQTSYWPGSPHTPPPGDRKDFNDPTRGDGHLWAVWHGNEPFEWYRTSYHRFCSEFGFQSFPEPRMIETFTLPEDRNVTSAVMEHHQRSGVGNSKIMHYMLSWYRMPVGWENTVWLSQLQQGMSIKYAVEHWRRNQPRCMGATYWQLNDCWPVASWASLDYSGRWKALHYMARRFFAPLLVSILEKPEQGIAELHVGNDLRTAFKGRIEWSVTLLDGTEVRAGTKAVKADALKTACVNVVKIGDLIAKHGANQLIVWVSLHDDQGARVAWNVATLVRPKHMPLPQPKIKVDIKAWDENSFAVTLSAKTPVLWVWLTLKGVDADYDDNFLCLEPNSPVRIRVTPKKRMTPAAFKAALTTASVWDTYQEQK